MTVPFHSCARSNLTVPVEVLERLKTVRYTAEDKAIVQASQISPKLALILKKMDISKPKPILAVG